MKWSLRAKKQENEEKKCFIGSATVRAEE